MWEYDLVGYFFKDHLLVVKGQTLGGDKPLIWVVSGLTKVRVVGGATLATTKKILRVMETAIDTRKLVVRDDSNAAQPRRTFKMHENFRLTIHALHRYSKPIIGRFRG